jgi:hypothetical protein
MAARGFSALELPCVKVLSVSGDGRSVQLDVSALDEFVKVAESVRFPLKGAASRADNILPVYHLPGELKRLGVSSSQDFTACYSDALAKLRAWAEKQGLSVVFWVYNPWATTELDQKGLFTESRVCLELARRVPGVRTLAALPSDVLPGGDIEIILPFADVVMSPPYASSKRIWERANTEELQSIWACGEGAGRFAYGFQAWRMGASGRWEAEYQNWVTPYNPFAGGRGLVHPGRGPVPTITFERITAGLTDVRYIALLKEKIDQAKNDPAAQALAKSAEEALARIASRAPAFVGASPGGADFLGPLPRQADGWRKEVVDQITSLMTALKEIEPPKAVETTRVGGSQGTQAPGDLMGWLAWRFPGWDPAHLLILAALGVILLAVLGVVLWRWRKESALEEDEEDEEEEEEEGEEEAAE